MSGSGRRGVRAALGAPEMAEPPVSSKNKSKKSEHKSKSKRGKTPTPSSSEESSARSSGRGKKSKKGRKASSSSSSSSELDSSVRRETAVPYDEPLGSAGDVQKVVLHKPLSER